MHVCVYGASSRELAPRYMEAGEALGKELARRGHTLVFGGGTTGLMGAVARGVTAENGRMLGIAPRFFNVDGILYEACDEWLYTDTMRERKRLMEQRSDAFVMTPGGVGTFDEFFEILTNAQLQLHHKPLAILNTDGYFDLLLQFLQTGVEERFMNQATLDLFAVFADPADLVSYLETAVPTASSLEENKPI